MYVIYVMPFFHFAELVGLKLHFQWCINSILYLKSCMASYVLKAQKLKSKYTVLLQV